jgi:DNA-binding NarL/FixJ family response regulator
MADRAMRLLVVDDDEGWRTALRMMFGRRADIVFTEAVSGQDAVEKVRDADYDLVLMDMRMPSGTEGLDALQQIKQLKPRTQVVMMSAFGDVRKTVEAMRRGALDFVPKEADFRDALTFKVNDFIRTFHLIADRELLIRAKYKAAQTLRNSQEKGKALEDLLAALLASIEGFIEVGRNVNTTSEEIDIVFRNESRNPAWQRESQIILVECKNWHSQRVGKNEFVLFKEKMENRVGRAELGFLVCTAEFAETIEKEMLRSSKTSLLVVPINGEALRRLVEAENRSELLRSFVDQALLV